MPRLTGCVLAAGVVLALAGCGSSSDTSSERPASPRVVETPTAAQVRAARRRAAAGARRTRRARLAATHRRQAIQAGAKAEAQATAEESASEEASAECDPNYSGACLSPTASDYDCAGGSGDGPEYTGTVTVVGEDHYGLDSDGDGVGCEPD
jgi:hypothetical protein